MFGQLRHKFFLLQEDISASCASTVKHLTSSTFQSSKLLNSYNAGDEILEYWQIQWESLHSAQDQNGKLATNCDRIIGSIYQKVSRQNESVKKLEVLVSSIPQLNEKLHTVIEILGNLETLCNDVEISLMALEDTIDAAEFQEKQLEKKIQSTMYQERRRAEFVELSSQLQLEYQRKKSEYEEKQKSISQEKQVEFQKKFDQDLRKFQNSGKVHTRRKNRAEEEVALETISLDDDDTGEDNQALEDFLNEPTSPFEKSQSSDSLHDLNNQVQVATETSEDTADLKAPDGEISRAESIYFTPDATTEKLEELTL